MKKIFCILLTVCLLLAGCVRDKTPDPTESPTAPTLAPMKTVWVRESQTSQTQGKTSRLELIYDGTRVTEAVFYDNEVESTRYAVECDENGNFICWTSHEEVQEYTYDAAGRLLSFNTYSGDKLTTGYTFAYDAAGNRTSLRLTIDRLNVDQRTDYLYDEAGRNTRQEVYLGGELTRYSHCECDEAGRITAMTGYTAGGTEDLLTEYVYDGDTETQISRNIHGEIIQTVVITRDGFGNIIRTENYSATGALLATVTTVWRAVVVPVDCPRASI